MKYPKVFLLLLCALSLCVSTVFPAGGWNWQNNLITCQLPWVFDESKKREESFYVIGWSKNSLIAIMEYRSGQDETGGGSTTLRVFVQNLVNDQIVYKWGETLYDRELSVSEAWNLLQGRFSGSLRDLGIISAAAVLNSGPAITALPDGTKASVTLRKTEQADRETGFIRSVVINADSSAGGTARIYNQKSGNEYMKYFTIAGYLTSPFEPRIAVVSYEIYLFPGSEYRYSLVLTGCHLNKGFK